MINWTLHDDNIEDYNRQQRERWLHDERGTVEVMETKLEFETARCFNRKMAALYD